MHGHTYIKDARRIIQTGDYKGVNMEFSLIHEGKRSSGELDLGKGITLN